MLIFVGVALVLLGALVGLWLIYGRGPRRRRAYHRAQVLLRSGQWRQALDLIQDLQQQGQATPVWQGRLRNLEGECHRAAGNQALKDQRYEEALEHLLLSTQLLNLSAEETRHQVIQTMLAEVR